LSYDARFGYYRLRLTTDDPKKHVRVLHHTAARPFSNSTALLLTHLKLSLFSPFNLRQFNTPSPKPPLLRPLNPQAAFALR
jgi:hypothetical protein